MKQKAYLFLLRQRSSAAPQAIHDSRKNFTVRLCFYDLSSPSLSSTVDGPRVTVQLVGRKISPSSPRPQPKMLPPGFSLTSLSPVASAAPPSAVASAARRCRHRLRLSSPRSGTSAWAAGLRRRRHADLGFRRGTGLGPGSAAHRRGWPARGGGVPRTRRGGEFICRSISSPQLPSPFRRRFRRRLLPALDQHGAGKRRSLGCRFLYQVSRLSCRDVE